MRSEPDRAEVGGAVGRRARHRVHAGERLVERELQVPPAGADAAPVAGRPQLLEQPALAQQGLELRAAHLVVEPVEALERPADQPAVAAARPEVAAHPPAQVGRLPDVEDLAVAVAHQVHAGKGRQILGQRQLVRVARRAGAGEGHRPLQRVDAALGEHLHEGHQQLGRRLGVGQGAVHGAHGRAGPVGERRQVVPLHPPAQQAPGQDQGVEPRLGEVAAGQPAPLVVEEAQVEGRVVRDQHVVAGEVDERGERRLDVRLALDHAVVDPGELGHDAGDRPARIHQRHETGGWAERRDAHRADLGDLRGPGRAAGGLEVDDAEGGVLQSGGVPVGRRQAHQVATEPGQPGVALDDLGHQPALQALRAAAQPQELRGHLADLERAAAAGQQRAQPVGERVAPLGARLGEREGQRELKRGRHGRATLTAPSASSRRPGGGFARRSPRPAAGRCRCGPGSPRRSARRAATSRSRAGRSVRSRRGTGRGPGGPTRRRFTSASKPASRTSPRARARRPSAGRRRR